MSMLFDLRRVSNDQLQSLLRDPSDIFFFLYGTEPYEPPKGFLSRLFSAKPKESNKTDRVWTKPPEEMVLSLDKNWHVLHYIFCRQPEEAPLPEATLLFGGVEIGTVDVGYGPARALRPPEVEKFLRYLESLDRETYASRITGKGLEESEIYASFSDWSQEDADALWEYVEEMKSFLRRAHSENESVLLYLY